MVGINAVLTSLLVLLLDFSSPVTYEKTSFVKGSCNEYFHGLPWPMLKDVGDDSTRSLVKLCQKFENGTGVTLYATLYNTFTRIPIYSANKVVLYPNQKINPRPDEDAWKKVATGLCNIGVLPKTPIYSNLGHVKSEMYKKCRKFQAVTSDYTNNHMGFDRGHLSPNHINSRNCEKQLGTFTLTNAAPQYADFNEQSWRIFECVTEFTIIDFVPGEPVYIITGTYGSALDKHGKPIWLNKNNSTKFYKNPVKAPGFYWKAVCYPGNNNGKDPWAYAVIEKNVNKVTTANYSDYITLKEFSQKYFVDPPFGDVCMNAGFGQFSKVFPIWDSYVKKNCQFP